MKQAKRHVQSRADKAAARHTQQRRTRTKAMQGHLRARGQRKQARRDSC